MLGPIIKRLEAGEEVLSGFNLEHSQLCYKGRYVLSKTSPLISILLHEYHNTHSYGRAHGRAQNVYPHRSGMVLGRDAKTDRRVCEGMWSMPNTENIDSESSRAVATNPNTQLSLGTHHYGFHRGFTSVAGEGYRFGRS